MGTQFLRQETFSKHFRRLISWQISNNVYLAKIEFRQVFFAIFLT